MAQEGEGLEPDVVALYACGGKLQRALGCEDQD